MLRLLQAERKQYNKTPTETRLKYDDGEYVITLYALEMIKNNIEVKLKLEYRAMLVMI